MIEASIDKGLTWVRILLVEIKRENTGKTWYETGHGGRRKSGKGWR